MECKNTQSLIKNLLRLALRLGLEHPISTKSRGEKAVDTIRHCLRADLAQN